MRKTTLKWVAGASAVGNAVLTVMVNEYEKKVHDLLAMIQHLSLENADLKHEKARLVQANSHLHLDMDALKAKNLALEQASIFASTR